MSENTECPHCAKSKSAREKLVKSHHELLKKYQERGQEMMRQLDESEAHVREVTAELITTLRDQFAMAALAMTDDHENPHDAARWVYAIADAMLKARKT